MPYTIEHKQKTRERIVSCAREVFNRKGFLEASIDDIMAQAGLTRGGFYSHFESKDDLFAEVIEAFGRCNATDRWDDVEFDPSLNGRAMASQAVQAYLSRSHLNDIGGHCPMIALLADIARAGPRVKKAGRGLLESLSAMLAAGRTEAGDPQARDRGLALAALCIGGMVLARAFDDPCFRDEIRDATRTTALELIG